MPVPTVVPTAVPCNRPQRPSAAVRLAARLGVQDKTAKGMLTDPATGLLLRTREALAALVEAGREAEAERWLAELTQAVRSRPVRPWAEVLHPKEVADSGENCARTAFLLAPSVAAARRLRDESWAEAALATEVALSLTAAFGLEGRAVRPHP